MSRAGIPLRRALIGLLGLAACAATAVSIASADARAAACPWLSASKSPNQRAHQLVAAMTLDDKIAMVHQPDPIWSHYGVAGYIPPNPRLCIPDLMLNDAGAGVGDMETGAVAFPVGIAQAATWDKVIERQFGSRLGWEAWHKGVNVQLAPDVNIARVPLNGRNSEAFGEDPFLSGQTAVAEINGIQQNPVIATVKHYALNNNEQNRMTVSADASARTIHEIYTPAFEAAVRQGHVGSVMCSYNRINLTYACENPQMLKGILEREFGFDGFVMSDWTATHSTIQSARAGLDMEMDVAPGKYYAAALKSAVQAGQVPMARLNDMVVRIVRPMFRLGIFARPHAAEPQASSANVETPGDISLARKIAEEGTVLLKNRANVLPLQGSGKRIALIGSAAGPVGTQESYGTGGSSHVPEVGPKQDVVTPVQGIQQRGAAAADLVTYVDGSSMADAIAAAKTADVAVVFANDGESEGNDRPDLSLSSAKFCTLIGCTTSGTNQDQLIAAVASANPNTVVVLDTGGPVLMPWINQVKSVLQAWYPGQQDGNAIAALLFGDVNPSGKLPQTFPRSMAQLPTQTPAQFPGVTDKNGVPRETYSEGLLVGYRWYDAKGLVPLFPFGFGLSYTTFRLGPVRIKRASAGGASVSISVVNRGARAGAEVPQVYVGLPTSTGEPPKRLAGYARVFLAPHARRTVTIALDRRAFSYWSAKSKSWVEARGCYSVMVGTSSRAIVSRANVAAGGARCAHAVAL